MSVDKCSVFVGGEREIRTLGTGLPHTRFPVVRLRPAQPSLRADFGIILLFCLFVKNFRKFSQIFFSFSICLVCQTGIFCSEKRFCCILSMTFSLFRRRNFKKLYTKTEIYVTIYNHRHFVGAYCRLTAEKGLEFQHGLQIKKQRKPLPSSASG